MSGFAGMWKSVLLGAVGVFAAGAQCFGLSISAGPYLQNPCEDSMTVMWITDVRCLSWVEYGTGESLDQKAYHVEHGLIDADRTIHRIAIEGLEAGREYRYRVCSREILKFEPYKVTYGETMEGEVHSFRTLSREKESISFVVLNDIHQRDDILRTLMEKRAGHGYELVFLNGDILGHIEDEAQVVRHVLRPCSEVFARNVPFVYVRGNHEARGKFARMLGEYLGLPGGKYYYSFDHGPVHFVVMDGGEDKNDGSPEYSGLAAFDGYREAQRVWLEKEIRTEAFRKAAFRVVIVHMPPGESARWHGPTDMYNKWRPLFNAGGVDLMLSGHLHRFMIMDPEAGVREYPMIIGGAPSEGQATVIRVDATSDRLEVTATLDNGKTAGTYRVQRRGAAK